MLLRASSSFGASPLRSFVRVTMPLISRGILTGAIFAFVTSFDEVVIALFLRSPTFQTLPVQMYNSVTVEIDPTISAASSLIVVAVTIIFLVPQLVGARKKTRKEQCDHREESSREKGAEHRLKASSAPRSASTTSRRTTGSLCPRSMTSRSRSSRRVHDVPRPERVGQDDDPQPHRRIRDADRGHDHAQRNRGRQPATAQAQPRHALPELRALPAHDRRPERRLSPARAQGTQGGDRRKVDGCSNSCS